MSHFYKINESDYINLDNVNRITFEDGEDELIANIFYVGNNSAFAENSDVTLIGNEAKSLEAHLEFGANVR
jgi:hypothetical protein